MPGWRCRACEERQSVPPRRRAPGGGALWSPCPPASACGRHLLLYLRLKGTPTRRLKIRGGQPENAKRRRGSFRKPSPVVAGRPLRVSKGGGRSRRRRPGDMERKGLPAAMGPVRSRRGKAKKQTRTWEKIMKKAAPPGGLFAVCAGDGSALEQLGDRRAQVAGRLDRGHAGLLQRGELAVRRARAAQGDGAGVAHALARGRAGAGDEADHRLGHVLGDVLGRLFLGAAADLADHDDAL